MTRNLDINIWHRREHFQFFTRFDEPFFGVTVKIDCTTAYQFAKENGISFFLYYLYQSLKAANEIEAFRYRIQDGQVVIHDQINASPTINRPTGTFGFAYMDFNLDETEFYKKAQKVIEHVRQTDGLIPAVSGENVIHYSVLPWLDFTAISHARCYSFKDSCPKISFGKMTEQIDGKKSMNVSIHVHHGLMDGYEVGLFVERFQQLMG